MTQVFKQNERVHIECEPGTNILIPDNKPTTGCEDSLYLGKKVFQAQGPLLCKVCIHAQEGGQSSPNYQALLLCPPPGKDLEDT